MVDHALNRIYYSSNLAIIALLSIVTNEIFLITSILPSITIYFHQLLLIASIFRSVLMVIVYHPQDVRRWIYIILKWKSGILSAFNRSNFFAKWKREYRGNVRLLYASVNLAPFVYDIDLTTWLHENKWAIDPKWTEPNKKSVTIDENRLQSMMIDEINSHKIFRHWLVIDFQYQSVNWRWLLSIDIDYHWLSVSSINPARVYWLLAVTFQMHP